MQIWDWSLVRESFDKSVAFFVIGRTTALILDIKIPENSYILTKPFDKPDLLIGDNI